VNKFVVRHPYPTTPIPQILRTRQGFTFVTVLDVNMGFWTIPLAIPSQKVCTTILPWGKYAYKHLPIGLTSPPVIFKERMSSIFADMPNVIVYQDDLLITSNGAFEDHLQMLDLVLQRLSQFNLQVNHKKSKFCGHEADYLGFHLTPDGILPQMKNVILPLLKMSVKSIPFLVLLIITNS
jgi:Reverse transcriptase (RNA-dependent DNA polymerase).